MIGIKVQGALLIGEVENTNFPEESLHIIVILLKFKKTTHFLNKLI